MATQEKQTPLGALVTAGDQQTQAEAITDSIFMVKDITNAYLVTTGDGDLMVNAGFIGNDARTKAMLAPHRTGPLRRVVICQAHADHYGALPGLLEKGTEVIAGAGFLDTARFFDELGPFLGRRSAKLWASMTQRNGPPPKTPEVVPDIEVSDRYAFEQGGKRFEVIKVPGGETLCSVVLWMPDEKIVFTGNLFGPVWRAMPNLTTTRGDKPRLVAPYLRSIEMVRELRPEIVITGHGEPVRGAETIQADLETMHKAVSYLQRETIAGMNGGKTVHQLMQEITLPPELKIGEFHGSTRWTVRAIWEENANWFKYEEGTTALYGSPRSSVDADLVDLAGGADKLAARARAKLEADQPLQALHLSDIALNVDPQARAALEVRRDASKLLLERSGGQNLSETMWLRSEISDAEKRLAEAG